MAAGPEALKKLLIRITDLETEWERIRQTLIEEGFVAESNAWEPDWAPWEKVIQAAIWERIDNWHKRTLQERVNDLFE